MIASFLNRLRPGGPFVLTAIVPDGKTVTRTFADAEKAEAWASHENVDKNIYWSVNKTRAVSKKASKSDVLAVELFHVDLDPRMGDDFKSERERIRRFLTTDRPKEIPEPSLVIDSGGGYQAFWKLRDPIQIDGNLEKAAEAERYNRALELAFSADACHNIDRIMRVPWTTNHPNKKKLAKGRIETIAEVHSWNDTSYPLSAFKQAPPINVGVSRIPVKTPKHLPLPQTGDIGVDELQNWAAENNKSISDHCYALVASGQDPIDPTKYESRSEALFKVCCDLIRAEVPDEMIYAVITGQNEIAASVRDKKNWQSYAQRQIERAHDDVKLKAEGPSWDRTTKDGDPLPSYWNTRSALRLMGVECRYDKFKDRHIVGSHELQELAGDFSDHAERILRDEIIRQFGFDPGAVNTNSAVLSLCTENRFDSLIDHIQALPPWDGTPRLNSWLSDYLGAETSPYTREAGAAWLTASIVRAFEPGTKFDYMLVLMGGQGIGKSTALRILAGDDFFSDASFLHARDAKEVLEVTAGVWILECAELDGMSKRDVSTLKAAIARQADTGRPAYARSAITRPRRFVLAGTTNEQRFLQDPTENRRFWPILVGQIDIAGLRSVRDQLWAEALNQYQTETYRLTLGEDATAGAKEAQAERRVVDEGYLERLEDLHNEVQQWKGNWIVTNDAVYNKLGIPPKDRVGTVPHKVKEAMSALGWTTDGKAIRIDGRVCRVFVWNGSNVMTDHTPF